MVQLTIHEGRNHQVKKMFEAVGLQGVVTDTFEYLDSDRFRPGAESVSLNKKEISQLHHGCNQEIPKRIFARHQYAYQRFISPQPFHPLVVLSLLERNYDSGY